jgi:hypothetical protein
MPTVPWRRVVPPQPDAEYLVMASRPPLRVLTKVPRFMALTLSWDDAVPRLNRPAEPSPPPPTAT